MTPSKRVMQPALVLALLFVSGGSEIAEAASRFSVGPYASVSSTKEIKPGEESSEESVTQRTTYGLRVGIGLMRFLSLDVKVGVNEVDQTKKSVALRDEFDEINFEEDANVDTNDPDAEYRYQESQKLGVAKFVFRPRLFRMVWLNLGAGVRARKRDLTITEKPNGTKETIDDPIKFHAVAAAGVGFRLLGSFTGSIDYDFYFIKFPETEPHEQEVTVSFGVEI